ncbi:hypothetical protein ACFV0W_37985 [Streptomyces anulatus]
MSAWAGKVVHDAAAISLLAAIVDPDQLQATHAKLGAASSVPTAPNPELANATTQQRLVSAPE